MSGCTTVFIKLPTDAAVKKRHNSRKTVEESGSIPGIGVIVSILVGFGVYRI